MTVKLHKKICFMMKHFRKMILIKIIQEACRKEEGEIELLTILNLILIKDRLEIKTYNKALRA